MRRPHHAEGEPTPHHLPRHTTNHPWHTNRRALGTEWLRSLLWARVRKCHSLQSFARSVGESVPHRFPAQTHNASPSSFTPPHPRSLSMLLYFLFSAASAQTEAQIKCPKHDMGIVMKYASCAVDPDCFVNPAGLCEAYPTKVVCHNYGVVDTCDDPPKYCSDCDCTLWGGCVAVSATQSPTPSTESPTMTPTAKPTIATVTSIPVPDVWGGACCKVCTIGKACGDSCISTGSVCKLSTGCACNAPPSTCETSTTWEDPWYVRARSCLLSLSLPTLP
jgi:hypothetical protein